MMEDFVDIATRRDPGLTENEAKKLLSSRSPEDQSLKQASIREVVSRNSARTSSERPFMRQPEMNKGKLSFTEDSLKQDYESKEQITQHGIDEFGDKMESKKEQIQIRREKIGTTVDARLGNTNSEIKLGKERIVTAGEKVKQGVKKRGKDGALWSAGRELKNTVMGDDDDK
jgi:hypothetical protein